MIPGTANLPVIGIDIGGTTTEAVRVGANGHVEAHALLATRHGPDLIEGAGDAVRAVLPSEGVARIGVGVPGQVDPVTGTVAYAVNLGLHLPAAGDLVRRGQRDLAVHLLLAAGEPAPDRAVERHRDRPGVRTDPGPVDQPAQHRRPDRRDDLVQTGFAMVIFSAAIKSVPSEVLESAYVDGASHFSAFTKLVLPLAAPVLAAFAIFQFLWVWNDFLVAYIFLGTGREVAVLTAQLQQLVGTRGEDWHLLTAGAFVSMVVPLIVFLAMQRYFVRGLLTGGVKG